jgi:hypothetical protein
MADVDKRIKVGIRIRPSIERERYETMCARKLDDGMTIVMAADEATAALSGQLSSSFNFDYAFDESDDQRTVYDEAAQEMIDHALSGNNVTIFTYGQTGSGKTYTILGKMAEDGSISPQSGMFLRVFDDLFSYQKASSAKKMVVIALSAIELYVEEVMDLLNNKSKVKIRDMAEDTQLVGLTSSLITKMSDVVEKFNVANSFRSVTATKMNDASSRSHAVFFIDVVQISLTPGAPPPEVQSLFEADGSLKNVPGSTRARISLVDLAGSERVKKSGVEGQGMVEAQAINKSLSTLGTVINAMYLQNGHIPFRESKLTKMLKQSFIDRSSRVLLIGQVAPPSSSYQESLGTLRFCDRVKAMKIGISAPCLDPEEEARYLTVMKLNEELCADIRIAREVHLYEPQRPRFVAARTRKTVNDVISSVVSLLVVDAGSKLAKIEERELAGFAAKCEAEANETITQFVDNYNEKMAELTELKARKKEAKEETQSLAEKQDQQIEEKTTEAKKAKKQRQKLEDKLTKLEEEMKEVEKQTAEVETKLAPLSSKRSATSDAFHSQQSTTTTPQSTIASTKSRSHFDDDDEAEPQPALLQPAATSRRTSSLSLASFSIEDDLEGPAEKAEVARLDHEWALLEANHLVVEEFHRNCAELNPLQSRFLKLSIENVKKQTQVVQNKMFASSTILYESTLLQDIIAFMIERAVYIGEGMLDSRDSWAWYDVEGSHKRLTELPYKNMLNLNMSQFPSVPRVEGHPHTHVSSDEDSDDPDAPHPVLAPVSTGPSVVPTNLTNSGGGVSTKDARERRRKMKQSAGNAKYEAEEADKQYLMTVYDSTTLVYDVTKYLKAGTVMKKHGRSGDPHDRLFWITTVSFRLELVWVDPENRNGDRKSIQLPDVASIALGPFSRVFRRTNWSTADDNFFMCFTLNMKDQSRTVDIVASTLPDFEAWTLGLCHLVKVDPHWGKPLDVSKDPATKELSASERALCEQNYIAPLDYIKVKTKVVGIRDEVAMHMRLFGNDAEQAFVALGGIHLPQVNHMGAVLMTKGELRFHCSPFKIDIFRVCKIWAVFAEQCIVYDPSFTPATNFGTIRKA